MDFLELMSPEGRRHIAAAFVCVTSLSFHKEVTKKRNSAVPSEASPSRANDVTLSLHSCLRKDKQIQALRCRLKAKRQHGRRTQAGKHALFLPATHPDCKNFEQKRDSKNPLLDLFAFELSKANKSAESLTLRANMSRAAVPRRVVCARTNGFQRRSLWRASWTLLAAKQEVS